MANTPLNPPELIAFGKWNDYRDEIWGDSYNWDFNRPVSQVKYLVIHHTVTKHEATPDDIALLHKARGWAGIGYSFVITKDGMVYYVGDIGTGRANVGNMNDLTIGITLVGDFTKHLPSDEQIRSAHLLCKFLLFSFPALSQVTSWEDSVRGHKEFVEIGKLYGRVVDPTACPGNDWKDTASSLYNRIKGNIPYSPQPQPTPIPTPTPPIDCKVEVQKALKDQQNKFDTQISKLKNQLTSEHKSELEAQIVNHNNEIKNLKANFQIEKAQAVKTATETATQGVTLIRDELNWYKKKFSDVKKIANTAGLWWVRLNDIKALTAQFYSAK